MIQLTPDEMAAVVLARQNRRVGVVVLAVVTGALWLLAAGLTAHLLSEYESRVMIKVGELVHWVRHPVTKPEPVAAANPVIIVRPGPLTEQERRERIFTASYEASQGLSWAGRQFAGIVAALLAALLSTFGLIFTVRRATLRQVQAVLADIAAQLAALNKSAGEPPASG